MEENIVQDQTNQPTEVQNQPPKPWLKIVLLGLVGLIVVGGLVFAGYKLGQREEQAKLPQPTPVSFLTPTSTPTPTPKTSPITVVATPSELTPTPDPTADWKIYRSGDLFFRYPPGWSISGYAITSNLPKITLIIVPSDSSLMNECMQEMSTETKGNLFIKKFSRVTTGEMCATSDSTPREIWIMKSPSIYAPGVSYKYSSTEEPQAEAIFDQILSTFKFLD